MTPKQKKEFFYQDKSGRGFTATYNLNDMRSCFKGERDWDGQAASTWASNAEIGDVWENAANKITRTK